MSVRCLSAYVQNDRYTVGNEEMFDTLTDLVEFYKRKGIEEISGNWVHFKQVNVCALVAGTAILFGWPRIPQTEHDPAVFPQPYYSTRVNAGDIGSRVKQLDETAEKQQEGESEKCKAGFWEEFDVRSYPASSYVTVA